MASQFVPWPDGARFTRVRLLEDGIPRDAHVRLVAPSEPGVSATLHLWQCAADGGVPLDIVVEGSEDGVDWVAAGVSHGTEAP